MHRRLTDVATPSDLILAQTEIVSEPKYLSDFPHGHLFLGHESPPRPVEKVRSPVVQRLRSDETFFRKSFRHVNNDSGAGFFSIHLLSESSIHMLGIFIHIFSECPIHMPRNPHSATPYSDSVRSRNFWTC